MESATSSDRLPDGGRAEAYLRTLIDSSLDVLSILGADGRIEFISRSVQELMGTPPEELIGTGGFERVHPDDLDRVHATFRTVLDGTSDAERVEYRLSHADGSWRNVETVGRTLVDPSGARGVVVSTRDVTERQLADERIRFQAQLLDSVAEAVIATDLQGRILYWNRFAEVLYGWRAHEVLGEDILDVTPGTASQAQAREIMRCLQAGESWTGEFTVRRWDGYEFPAHVTNAPILDAAGRLTGVVGVSFDLTERKRLEAQLIQAQKMDAVGRLAGGVAHDFNNLMMTVSGYAGLLLADSRPGTQIHGDLVEIAAAAQRATELTRKLLAFGRKQVVPSGGCDLNASVESMRRNLFRMLPDDVCLVIELTEGVGDVNIAFVELEQVIVNLALNARDAMPEGGELRISTGTTRLSRQAARDLGVEAGRYAVLGFEDEGCGIPKEDRERIFEPFFTTKPTGRGTGLGLSTVYGIVRQRAGAVTVDSEEGRGARFTVYLPPAPAATRVDPAERGEPAADAEAETILLAEDEAPVREFLQRVLEEEGYRVLTAGNGHEALEIAFSQSGPIDLLLTDVVMPGMGGIELAERLRKVTPEVKVLFLSGYSEDAVRHGGVFEGAVFLEKSSGQRIVLATIDRMLHEHSANVSR